jgi:hypothetical protein
MRRSSNDPHRANQCQALIRKCAITCTRIGMRQIGRREAQFSSSARLEQLPHAWPQTSILEIHLPLHQQPKHLQIRDEQRLLRRGRRQAQLGHHTIEIVQQPADFGVFFPHRRDELTDDVPDAAIGIARAELESGHDAKEELILQPSVPGECGAEPREAGSGSSQFGASCPLASGADLVDQLSDCFDALLNRTAIAAADVTDEHGERTRGPFGFAWNPGTTCVVAHSSRNGRAARGGRGGGAKP